MCHSDQGSPECILLSIRGMGRDEKLRELQGIPLLENIIQNISPVDGASIITFYKVQIVHLY